MHQVCVQYQYVGDWRQGGGFTAVSPLIQHTAMHNISGILLKVALSTF